MNFEEKNKKMDKKNLFWGVVLMVALAVLTFLMFLLFRTKETYYSTGITGGETAYLLCDSGSPQNPFFASRLANTYKHEVRIAFANGFPSKITYNYYGNYDSAELVAKDESIMHADYNIYMGKHNMPQAMLAPTFANLDNVLKINLYADSQSLNLVTAAFFFLDGDWLDNFFNNTYEDLQKMYVDKGFSCEYSE